MRKIGGGSAGEIAKQNGQMGDLEVRAWKGKEKDGRGIACSGRKSRIYH